MTAGRGPLLLATRSPGKLRELRPLFARAGLAVIDLREAGIPVHEDEEAVEAFATFEENALAKARHFHQRSALPTIADDSGLEVAVLGGAPGVRSKRWSGRTDLDGQALDDANNETLLSALRTVGDAEGAGVPVRAADRRARYVCVAAYSDGARELAERGESTGTITDAPRGHDGFGYDPYFYSTELGKTFGESSAEEKEAVSHRGRAFRALLRRLAIPL